MNATPGASKRVAIVGEEKTVKLKRPTFFCPWCNAIGRRQPVLSPLAASPVRFGGDGGALPEGLPFLAYGCKRCGYAEIHLPWECRPG